MQILCTFPGKTGDLLWALPSLRAISEALEGEPIDLLIAGAYRGLVPLLERQPYLRHVEADPDWIVQDTAPMTPRIPAHRWWGLTPTVFHLGYRGWPTRPLPYETYACLQAQWPPDWPSLPPLDLDRPWITAPAPPLALPPAVTFGWTDEHFELKVGLTALLLLKTGVGSDLLNVSWSPRWQVEWWEASLSRDVPATAAILGDWRKVAGLIATTQVFCGDCSALHVLACAVGTPVVVMEPNPHRHHEIFYPYGTEGRVRLVRGNDGLPSFDARHTWDGIQAVLGETA